MGPSADPARPDEGTRSALGPHDRPSAAKVYRESPLSGVAGTVAV
jgi:hypothetical protein